VEGFAAHSVAVASELHGDGAGAFGEVPILEVAECGAADAEVVESVMFMEAGVFAGEECVDEVMWDVVEGDENAIFAVQVSDALAAEVEDLGAFRHAAEIGEVDAGGEVGVEAEDECGEKAESGGGEEEASFPAAFWFFAAWLA